MTESLDSLSLEGLDGAALSGADWSGKAVLFVNVASRCGYTKQYAGLQKLYEDHAEGGLVIVGVPCNQFGAQEPGTAEEIQSFCTARFGVTFPLLAKQDVNGPNRSPLYRWLIGDGADVRWNFEKFLVGRDGTVKGRFGSGARPDGPELTQAIQAALG